MKEHQHPYWGEGKKYWKNDGSPEDYQEGAKHFQRGHKDGKSGASYSPPTKKHEESYRQGHHEGSKENY